MPVSACANAASAAAKALHNADKPIGRASGGSRGAAASAAAKPAGRSTRHEAGGGKARGTYRVPDHGRDAIFGSPPQTTHERGTTPKARAASSGGRSPATSTPATPKSSAAGSAVATPTTLAAQQHHQQHSPVTAQQQQQRPQQGPQHSGAPSTATPVHGELLPASHRSSGGNDDGTLPPLGGGGGGGGFGPACTSRTSASARSSGGGGHPSPSTSAAAVATATPPSYHSTPRGGSGGGGSGGGRSSGVRSDGRRGGSYDPSEASSSSRRVHAQDAMVIPTAAARAMLGGRERGGGGMVPVGRDVPIGLNIERFLGAANPFGQDPFKKRKGEEVDEAQLIQNLAAPAESMGRVLAARLSHLKVVSAVWASSGPAKALLHALDMDDDAVLVDVLNGSQPKLHAHVTVDLALDLVPAVRRLVDSEYEDYLLAGLAAGVSILKAVGHVMRDTADAAAHGGMFRGGVSLAFEERVERCEALAEALMELRPRLDELSHGRGRSAQLAARLTRSLNRAIGEPVEGVPVNGAY